MNTHQSAAPFLIVAAPLLTSFVLPLLGRWRAWTVFPVTLAALAVSGGAAVATARTALAGSAVHYHLGGWEPPWGIEFRIDSLGALMVLLLSGITLLVAVYSRRSILQELPGREAPFYCVYLLLVGGLHGIVATADLFNMYVFLEITSLTSYTLVALAGGAALVSAFRYLILGTVGAAFYLLAVGYLYSTTGTLNMADMAGLLPDLYDSNAVRVGLAFLVIGLGIKMALFPLHAWLPGAYAEAPSAVSALIAATTTKVAAFALIRMLFFVFEPRFSIEVIPVAELLAWAGAAAMVLGSVMAIAQTDLKRMLAYSSVAQIGYIALGAGLANADGLTGGLLHLVNHAVMKGCLFLAAGAIVYRTGTRDIAALGQLAVRMPWTTGAFTVAAFAMVGIPPGAGFFSKLYLILGAVEAGRWVFVAAILLSSILALAYFVKVIRLMYFPAAAAGGVPAGAEAPRRHEAPAAMVAPMVILAACTVLLGLFNGEIVSRFITPVIPAAFAP